MFDHHALSGWAILSWEQDGKFHVMACPHTGSIDMTMRYTREDFTIFPDDHKVYLDDRRIEVTFSPRGWMMVSANDMRTALNRAFEILRRPGGPFAS